MWFSLEGFSEDVGPCLFVGADVVEGCSFDLYVNWRLWWTVEHDVENGVFSDGLAHEQSGFCAFVDYIQASCIVQVLEICARMTYS